MYIYLEKQKLKKKIVIITNHRSIIFYQDETKILFAIYFYGKNNFMKRIGIFNISHNIFI